MGRGDLIKQNKKIYYIVFNQHAGFFPQYSTGKYASSK
jgi:hypothetical protein